MSLLRRGLSFCTSNFGVSFVILEPMVYPLFVKRDRVSHVSVKNNFVKKIVVVAFVAMSFFAIGQEEIRKDWFNDNIADNKVVGASIDQTYEYLLEGKEATEIIVAVIDSGVDVEHEDLQGSIWVNEDEIPNNGIDDDNNGYIDDINGWSFISGPEEDVTYDNLEFTRIYKSLKSRFEKKSEKEISKEDKKDFARYLVMEKQYKDRLEKAKTELAEFEQIVDFYYFAKMQLDGVLGANYTLDDVKSIEPTDEMGTAIKDFMTFALEEDFAGQIEEGFDHYRNTLNYSYNLKLNSREIVGDNPDDVSERFYGSNRVEGPRAEHGTHVAGIIAAQRGNNMGMDGVSASAKIMVLRAVPDGDERDKDIANAIRYAADNGAKVINMSFGKSYSPNKSVVDEAVAYAESKGIILVHAAGNSSKNNDKSNNFPNPVNEETRELCKTWIEVGANAPQVSELIAPFSNYGKKSVDIFAPGVDIYSTIPNNEYKKNSGTSMAAPVVSGVVALLWSYYPELSATDVRTIIVESYEWYGKKEVLIPGDPKSKETKFKKLSRKGGVVNAFNAFKMAEEYRQKSSS